MPWAISLSHACLPAARRFLSQGDAFVAELRTRFGNRIVEDNIYLGGLGGHQPVSTYYRRLPNLSPRGLRFAHP